MPNQSGTGSTKNDASTEPEHGGRLAEARRLFPRAPEPFIDLSTGINPVPYPIGNLPAEHWARLPEPEAILELQRAAARRYGATDPDMVVAAPGTQILISLLPFLLPYRAVAILGPTYSEHAAAWRGAGATTAEIGDLEAAGEATCIVLCNPNNPDGRRTPPARLLALADQLNSRDGLLIVDEAFADFEPSLSLAPSLPHPAILILRSFGKAYGLAGLRLGFALAPPDRAARLRTALGPWAVAGPAAAIGRAALRDSAWIGSQAARLAESTARLDRLLRDAGLPVSGGTHLFRLARSDRAQERFSQLGRAGISVRRFSQHQNWLRFGLPATESAWSRLDAALRG